VFSSDGKVFKSVMLEEALVYVKRSLVVISEFFKINDTLLSELALPHSYNRYQKKFEADI
jgi:hypothetical protein